MRDTGQTYQTSGFRGLPIRRALRQPPHTHAVTSVHDVEQGEGNLRLRSLRVDEGLARCERRGAEVLGPSGAAVDDDADGGGVVGEVLGQGGQGELVTVFLDQAAKGLGHVGGVVLVDADGAVGFAGFAMAVSVPRLTVVALVVGRGRGLAGGVRRRTGRGGGNGDGAWDGERRGGEGDCCHEDGGGLHFGFVF